MSAIIPLRVSLDPSSDKGPDFSKMRPGRTLHSLKEGWIHKKGGQSFSAFRKRYMILWSNKRIEYYTDDTATELKGAVNLIGLHKKAIQRSDKVPKKMTIYGFRITTKKRTWYFAAKQETDREQWIKTIRAVVEAPIEMIPSPFLTPNQSVEFSSGIYKHSVDSITNTTDQEEDDVPSDYDPEDVLEELERQYNEKHYPHRKGKQAYGIQWSDEEECDILSQDSLNDSEDPLSNDTKESINDTQDSLNDTEDEALDDIYAIDSFYNNTIQTKTKNKNKDETSKKKRKVIKSVYIKKQKHPKIRIKIQEEKPVSI